MKEVYREDFLPLFETPSAEALRAYLSGPGRLQEGSPQFADAGNTWLRPLKGGRWYSERVHTAPLKCIVTVLHLHHGETLEPVRRPATCAWDL